MKKQKLNIENCFSNDGICHQIINNILMSIDMSVIDLCVKLSIDHHDLFRLMRGEDNISMVTMLKVLDLAKVTDQNFKDLILLIVNKQHCDDDTIYKKQDIEYIRNLFEKMNVDIEDLFPFVKVNSYIYRDKVNFKLLDKDKSI